MRQQWRCLLRMLTMRDLSLFIFSFIFLSGASSVALSVAAIIAQDVLGVSVVYIGAGALVGLIAAVIGLQFFRWLLRITFLSVKHVLIINVQLIIDWLFEIRFKSVAIGVCAHPTPDLCSICQQSYWLLHHFSSWRITNRRRW